MRSVVDSRGRIVIPKQLRDAFGLHPGRTIDVSLYGRGLQLTLDGRTARLVEVNGALVAQSNTAFDDTVMFDAIDVSRR